MCKSANERATVADLLEHPFLHMYSMEEDADNLRVFAMDFPERYDVERIAHTHIQHTRKSRTYTLHKTITHTLCTLLLPVMFCCVVAVDNMHQPTTTNRHSAAVLSGIGWTPQYHNLFPLSIRLPIFPVILMAASYPADSTLITPPASPSLNNVAGRSDSSSSLIRTTPLRKPTPQRLSSTTTTTSTTTEEEDVEESVLRTHLPTPTFTRRKSNSSTSPRSGAYRRQYLSVSTSFRTYRHPKHPETYWWQLSRAIIGRVLYLSSGW